MSYIYDQKRECVQGPACLNNMATETEWETFSAHFPIPEMKEFLDYWRGHCSNSTIPDRKDIRPVDMKKFLANVSIIDLDTTTYEAHYRLLGSNVAEMIGKNIKGKSLSEVAPINDVSFFKEGFKKISKEGRVLLNIFNLSHFDKEHMMMYNLALPLNYKGEVSKILYYSYLKPVV